MLLSTATPRHPWSGPSFNHTRFLLLSSFTAYATASGNASFKPWPMKRALQIAAAHLPPGTSHSNAFSGDRRPADSPLVSVCLMGCLR